MRGRICAPGARGTRTRSRVRFAGDVSGEKTEMSYDDLVRRVEGRLLQTEQMQAAQRKDVLELTQLARGMAAHNAKLTLELGLREPTMDEQPIGPATGGTWEGSEAQRQELLNTAAWQAKYHQAVREAEIAVEEARAEVRRVQSEWRVDSGHQLWLEEKLVELLELRVEADGGCADCDGGWIWS